MPTIDMWFDMLAESGFEPKKDDVYRTLSYVSPEDWVRSNQMTVEGLEDMNRFLLSAPRQAKKDFNIRQEEGSVK
jgi:hypothetical protein